MSLQERRTRGHCYIVNLCIKRFRFGDFVASTLSTLHLHFEVARLHLHFVAFLHFTSLKGRTLA